MGQFSVKKSRLTGSVLSENQHHNEWVRNLAANTPGLPMERLAVTRDRMKAVLPEADVADYSPLIAKLELPDPDDRHVLAAAIAGKASVIVTWNLKDFPARHLLPHGVVSQSPDDFLSDLYAASRYALISSVGCARHNLCRTKPSVEVFLDTLQQGGLKKFSGVLRRNIAALK
tara:strand:- start:551 stop:1069 length:519 start_codon:yes stop_codon:yes gene_type:complete